MKQEKTKTKKIFLRLLLIALTIYGLFVLFNYILVQKETRNREIMQEEKEKIIKESNTRLAKTSDLLKQSTPSEKKLNIGKTGQFEGPQVTIHALECMGNVYMEKDQARFNHNPNGGMLFFKGNVLSFDPDHPNFGMANLRVEVGPVELYRPEGKVEQFLGGILGSRADEEKPYRVYEKTLISNDDQYQNKHVKLQLWITRFHIRVSIWPDRKVKKPKNAKDIRYDGRFHFRVGEISLAELKPEYKNQRYANVNVVFKVTPNNAPFYILTVDDLKDYFVASQQPEIGVAALICSKLVVNNEKGQERIAQLLHKGSILSFYDDYSPAQGKKRAVPVLNLDKKGLLDSVSGNIVTIEQVLNDGAPGVDSRLVDDLWNKEKYVWIHFDNIGSWHKWEGIWKGVHRFADFVDYEFLLLVLVRGEWQVKMPVGLSDWEPQKPYEVRKSFWDYIIPDFGFGKIGRGIFVGFLLVIGILFLFNVFPVLSQIIGSIFKGIRSLFK